MEKKEKRMNMFESVFNCHINDAKKKAYAELQQQSFKWYQEVKEIEENEQGIMAVFNHEPLPATSAFCTLVNYFVNEGRE